MIIHSNFPNGFAIFCDDVREELHGKLTFVGVYGGEMTVYGAAPLVLPSLAVVMRYREEPDALPKHIKFRISRDIGVNSDVLFETEIDAPALPEEFKFPETSDVDSRRFIEMQCATKLPNLLIPGDCEIKVRAYYGDDEVRLGKLQVKVAPYPNQADPPTP